MDDDVRQATLLGDSVEVRSELEGVKHIVEKGPNWLKLVCFSCCALSLAFDAVSVLTDLFKLDAMQMISSIYAGVFSLTGLALEFQSFFSSRTRKWLNVWVKVLNRTWGRGLFYLICGGLHLAIRSTFGGVLGILLILCGACCLIVSRVASSKLVQLHSRIVQGHTEDLVYVRQVFNKMDVDSSGFLSAAELASACKELGTAFTTTELVAIFNYMDDDDDGKVSYEEFEKFWRGQIDMPWTRIPLV